MINLIVSDNMCKNMAYNLNLITNFNLNWLKMNQLKKLYPLIKK